MIQPGHSLKSDLALGWTFAFGFFLAGLYWVGISATVDIGTFWWFVPIASAGLPALLAFFVMPIPALVTKYSQTTLEKVLLFVALWLVHEWLRSWVLSGFPWNLIGYSASFSLEMLQLASIGGVWLLSAALILAASLPVLFLENRKKTSLLSLTASLLIPIMIFGYGSFRLSGSGVEYHDPKELALHLVQANIPQTLKWDPDAARQNLQRQIALSQISSEQQKAKNLVIWSESSIPYLLDEDENLRSYLAQSLPANTTFMTGSNRREIIEGNKPRYFNSFFVMNEEAEILSSYDKRFLVPFGEYVPLSDILPIQKLTAGLVDFTSGDKTATIKVSGIPTFAPLICYEVIFPGHVVPENQERPSWLLNITNDAWFGKSSGPYQHFSMAQMRAVEEGLPLIRVSNPGISAIIGPRGKILLHSKLDEATSLTGYLPKPIAKPPLFARLGNWSIALILLLLAIIFVFCRVHKSRYSLSAA